MIAHEVPFQAIAQAIGTPYYCYSANDMRDRFRQLRTVLPEGIGYLYSLKANPNKSVVEILYREGAGCEVCSLAELETTVCAGVPPRDVVFVGPAKSIDELSRCVELGVRAVIVESLPELSLLNTIAAARMTVQAIAIRINPTFKASGAKLVMGGRPTQFGIDEDQLDEVVSTLRTCGNVTLVGLHVYMGSRILKVPAILENTTNILDLAIRLQERTGDALDFVDVGGGFGVNYFDGEPELDIRTLAADMRGIAERFARRCPSVRILLELGRYLVAQSGIFVTSVRYTKRSKGKLFAICDGGSNCHGAAAGLGSFMRRNFPVARLTGDSRGDAVYTITGPLCTPTDVIAEDVALGEIEIGDLIGVFHSGAYGPSASPVHFLGFGHPAEVIVDGDRVQLIRQRDSVDEMLAHQVALPIDLSASTISRLATGSLYKAIALGGNGK